MTQQIGRGEQSFDGELVAPLVDEFSAVRSLVGQFEGQQQLGQQRQAVGRALSGEPSFEVGTQESERVFRDSVLGPALEAFDEEIAPRIDAGFAGQGGTFSSRRGLARQRALEDLMADSQAQLAQFVRQDRNLEAQLSESAADRSLQGVGLASQLDMQPLQQSQAFASALSPFQQQEDRLRQAELQEFLRTLPTRNPVLDLAVPFGTARTRQSLPQQKGLLVEEGAGALGTLGGLAMFSDRKYKNVTGPTDVSPDEALQTLVETPIYDWSYKVEDHQRTGVVSDSPGDMPWMAGEVFDPMTAFGYTVLGFKALKLELQDLRNKIGA